MAADPDVEKRLRDALDQAFLALTGERAGFRRGMVALANRLRIMLASTPPCGFSENPKAVCTHKCRVGERSTLDGVLVHLSRATLGEPDLASRLERDLERTWLDLVMRYESHQFRLVGALWGYLGDDEMGPWLGSTSDSKSARAHMAVACQSDYPSDDMECQLRFQALVWFVVAALHATLRTREAEGWRHLQSAFLIAEAFRRGHLALSAGAAAEVRDAGARGNDIDQVLWKTFKTHHDAWFARWWTLFGPLHAWLNQEMDLCPSRIEKVFRVLGDGAWELSLMELLERAAKLLD